MSRSYSASATAATAEENPEEWHWEWLGSGFEDIQPARGRVYYKALTAYRASDNVERIYNVGDPVVLPGGPGAKWVAQIINLFEEHPDEYEERQLQETVPNTDPQPYKYMRCTLRWFASPCDLPEDSLKISNVPTPVDDEIYVSDHVEEDGFNCVAEIEGMAWLIGSVAHKEEFEREPDPRCKFDVDRVCVVRGFVNDHGGHVVRSLEEGELFYILKHPCSDRHLHDTSPDRMIG